MWNSQVKQCQPQATPFVCVGGGGVPLLISRGQLQLPCMFFSFTISIVTIYGYNIVKEKNIHGT